MSKPLLKCLHIKTRKQHCSSKAETHEKYLNSCEGKEYVRMKEKV